MQCHRRRLAIAIAIVIISSVERLPLGTINDRRSIQDAEWRSRNLTAFLLIDFDRARSGRPTFDRTIESQKSETCQLR